ncbi:MAG: T9SS type A sorting domain-containing protein [Ignavibacteriales bacterium]|nr:T9SS type A sorting domain-containing protein [Ignavibacteriales bacterium]
MKKIIQLLIVSSLVLPQISMAQWIQTNGPYGGDIRCFTVSPNGAGGTNLFAGSDESFYDGGGGHGVFLSTNNGTSWTAVNTGLTDLCVHALAASPATDGAGSTNLFAGTAGSGVFLSTNNGTSWTATGLTSTGVFSLAVSTAPGEAAGSTNLFAGTYGGVFLSTNNGTNWTQVNTGLPSTPVWTLAVSPNGAGGTNLFAGASGYVNGIFYSGVFLSTNSGTNWSAVNAGLTNTYVNALTVSSPSDLTGGANLFAGTRGDMFGIGGVFLSTNNGASWTAVNTGLTNAEVFSLCVSPNGAGGTNLFAGTMGRGVYLSTNNGTSWTAASMGLAYNAVLAFAVSPNGTGGTNLFAGTCNDMFGIGGVFLSTNNGTNWTAANAGLTKTIINALGGGAGSTNLFAGTGGGSSGNGGVFLSTNNGTSWTALNTGLPAYSSVNAFAVSPNGTGRGLDSSSGTNVIAGTDYGVVFSTNNGTSWTAVSTGLTSGVYSFAVSGTNLFAGTEAGVFVSTNNGTIWTSANTGLTGTYVRALAVSLNGSGGMNLFAGTFGGVFLSTNNGTSWSAVNYLLPKNGNGRIRVNALAVFGTNLFAGTYGGIFLSTNNGTSWTAVNDGLPRDSYDTTFYIGAIAFTVSGTNLFAGTNSGVWRRPLSEMVSVKHSSTPLPERFGLGQNYPNPFNPTTSIEYSITQQSQVTVSIFDLLGCEVAVLVNEKKDAGRYSVHWNASAMPSGVYFYTLNAGQFRETKRMSLIK